MAAAETTHDESLNPVYFIGWVSLGAGSSLFLIAGFYYGLTGNLMFEATMAALIMFFVGAGLMALGYGLDRLRRRP